MRLYPGASSAFRAVVVPDCARDCPGGYPPRAHHRSAFPMRRGVPIRAHLLYPIYANNTLLLRKGTVVTGVVVGLLVHRKRRVNAALGATLLRSISLRCTSTTLFSPTVLPSPLAAGVATNGTPIYRAIAPPPARGGFFRREFDSGITAVRTDVAVFTRPGKPTDSSSSSTAACPTIPSASRRALVGPSKLPRIFLSQLSPPSRFPPSGLAQAPFVGAAEPRPSDQRQWRMDRPGKPFRIPQFRNL